MRAMTTADRERFARTGMVPVSRRERLAGTATALLFVLVPIVAPFLPGGVWS